MEEGRLPLFPVDEGEGSWIRKRREGEGLQDMAQKEVKKKPEATRDVEELGAETNVEGVRLEGTTRQGFPQNRNRHRSRQHESKRKSVRRGR